MLSIGKAALVNDDRCPQISSHYGRHKLVIAHFYNIFGLRSIEPKKAIGRSSEAWNANRSPSQFMGGEGRLRYEERSYAIPEGRTHRQETVFSPWQERILKKRQFHHIKASCPSGPIQRLDVFVIKLQLERHSDASQSQASPDKSVIGTRTYSD